MQCVVLAGGMSTRLKGLFGPTPKHLVPVNNRPFADYQISRLLSQGFTRLTYALGFGAELLEEYLSQSVPSEIRVDTVRDGATRLGTGGAVRNLLDRGYLEEMFALTYGDTLLNIDPALMFSRLQTHPHVDAVMSIWHNNDRLGTSNADFDGTRVTNYDKSGHTTGLEYIDYGMLILRRRAVDRLLPKNRESDLSEMIATLAEEGAMLGYEVFKRFYEIGTIEALRETETYLARQSGEFITQTRETT